MERLEAQKILHMALDTELQISMLEMEQAANIKPQKEKVIYCGDEDYVEFFERVVEALDLHIDYEVFDVDGELEVVVHA